MDSKENLFDDPVCVEDTALQLLMQVGSAEDREREHGVLPVAFVATAGDELVSEDSEGSAKFTCYQETNGSRNNGNSYSRQNHCAASPFFHLLPPHSELVIHTRTTTSQCNMWQQESVHGRSRSQNSELVILDLKTLYL